MESESPKNAGPPGSARMPACSAVLLNWKRPRHIPEIVRNLLAVPQVTEVIVWCNECQPTPEIRDSGARTLWSETNEVTLGRFLAAREATQDVVYTQDDDLLVHNVPALLEAYAGRPQIVANLADDRSSRHWTWWQARHPPWVELGFGSVFPRAWAADLDGWPYDRELLRRKADKVFTVTHQWTAVRAGPNELTRLFHNGQETGRDGNALSNRKDHQRLTEQAVALSQEWCAKPPLTIHD